MVRAGFAGRMGPLGRRRPYDPDALNVFNRMSVEPSPERKALYNTLITTLKAEDVWPRLDALWLLAAHDAQAARLNLVSASYELLAVNSPAFTIDVGYAGDATTSYLDTRFSPMNGPNAALSSFSMGVKTNGVPGATARVIMGNERNSVNHRNSSDLAIGRSQSVSSDNVSFATTASSRRWSVVNRTLSASFNMYTADNSAILETSASIARPSTSINDMTIYLGGQNNAGVFAVGSTLPMSVAWVGAGLTSYQLQRLVSICSEYTNQVGAL